MKANIKFLAILLLTLTMHFALHAQNSYDKIDLAVTLDPDNDGNNATDSYYDEQVEQVLVQPGATEGEPETVYIVGRTYSTVNGVDKMTCVDQTDLGNNGDVFVACYVVDYWPVAEICGTLKWTTYLGSDDAYDYDYGYCMTLDDIAGTPKLFVGGVMNNNTNTASTCAACGNGSVYQPSTFSDKEAFIARLNCSDGALEAWTYFGGSKDGVEPLNEILSMTTYNHNIYFCGYTESKDNLPWQDNPIQTSPVANPGDNGDGFFAEIDECLHELKLFTYYNADYAGNTTPDGQDRCHSIKVYGDGADTYLVLSGTTESPAAIATPSAWSDAIDGGNIGGNGIDGFVGKWKVDVYNNLTVVWSTYIGGAKQEHGRQLDLDGDHNIFVTGWTTSDYLTFPAICNVYQTASAGGVDAYVAKILSSSTDGTPAWLTYFGGNDDELVNDIKWFQDDNNNSYVSIAGYTNSDAWSSPSVAKLDPYLNYNGFGAGGSNFDAFIAILDDINDDCNTTQSLPFSTYVGGSGNEHWGPDGYGPYIAFAPQQQLYLAFTGNSDNLFSTMNTDCSNCFDHMVVDYHNNGFKTYSDAFLMRFVNTNYSMDDCQYYAYKHAQDQTADQTIEVLPNPTSNNLIVRPSFDATSYQIVDLSGKEILSKNLSSDVAGDFTIDVSSLSNGMYLLKLNSDSPSQIAKFSVQR